MPIRIPDSLPASKTLEEENIFVITEHRAIHQDIRPLKLLILNLMPTKIVTETQLLRKLSNTPLQVEIELLRTISHDAKNVDAEHLESFYVSFADIKGLKVNTDIRELALLGLCNRLGRDGKNRSDEEKNVDLFLQKCGVE